MPTPKKPVVRPVMPAKPGVSVKKPIMPVKPGIPVKKPAGKPKYTR